MTSLILLAALSVPGQCVGGSCAAPASQFSALPTVIYSTPWATEQTTVTQTWQAPTVTYSFAEAPVSFAALPLRRGLFGRRVGTYSERVRVRSRGLFAGCR